MNSQLDLKKLERKVFRSTYQDGMWDMYYGLVMICMAIFVYRPASGYSPINIVIALCAIAAASGLFRMGKKLITVPRLGQVQFGAERKRRKLIMVVAMTIVVLFQVVLFLMTLLVWAHPEWILKYKNQLPDRNFMDLIVACIGALMVGPSMVLVAYFKDFSRGYFIAIMIALAVFLMLFLNEPIYPIIIGSLIALPGFVLFVRFLKKYPQHKVDLPHD